VLFFVSAAVDSSFPSSNVMKATAHGGTTPADGAISIQLQFDPKDVVIGKGRYGLEIEFDGAFVAGPLGGPALPAQCIRVAFPVGTRPTAVHATPNKSKILGKKGAQIAPVQPPGEAGEIAPASRVRPELPPNKVLYEREHKSPRPLARLASWELFGSTPVALIVVNPIALGPENTVRLHTSFTVDVSYGRQSAEPTGDKHLLRPTVVRHASNTEMAAHLVASARDLVINPNLVVTGPSSNLTTAGRYLIITDNWTWNSVTMQHVANKPDVIEAFTLLKEWKERRGLSVTLVTVTDIVGGVYGDFRSDAVDLQEVIRNYIKYAHKNLGVSWVLLGGGKPIIPVRQVLAGAVITLRTENPPQPISKEASAGFFVDTGTPDQNYLKVTLGSIKGYDDTAAVLVNLVTGAKIGYDDSGTARPGWNYCDSSFSTKIGFDSGALDRYAVVRGTDRDLRRPLEWATAGTLIPTDLYYSSLIVWNDPAHDWDVANKGYYGAHADVYSYDGVNFHADVSVGRVPARTGADAKAWVDKLIAYEQFRNPDPGDAGMLLDLNWPNQALLVADSWWEWDEITESEAPPPNNDPPADRTFVRRRRRLRGTTETSVLLNTENVRDTPGLRIWARTGENAVRIDYKRDASKDNPGFFFASSDTDPTPAQESEPTKWILIHGKADKIVEAEKYAIDRGDYLDGSARAQDRLSDRLSAELREIQVSKLYEDHVYSEIDFGATVPEIGVPFLAGREALQDKLNQLATHFLSISGHGTWKGTPSFRRDAVKYTTNRYQSWIAYVYGCNTAQFDVDNTPSIGERALNRSEGAAVAYIGASRKVQTEDPVMARDAFFHALQNPDTRHLGQLADTRLWRLLDGVDFEVEPTVKNLIFMFNLFGDPEMPVWVGSPKTMTVTLPGPVDLKRTFDVVVREERGRLRLQLQDAIVTLRQAGDLPAHWRIIAKSKTDAQGRAALPLQGAAAGPVEITVTKQGYIPFMGPGKLIPAL
jgi:hypothetical protein